MADDLGAAKLSLIIDMADWDVAIQRGKNSLSNLSSDSAQAFNNATHASKRAATSLADYVAYLGKTADQTRLLRAAKNGVDPAAIAAAAEQMRAFAEASAHAENEQRQLAAALAQMRVGEGIVAELREQIATFGMGKNELTLYRAALAGVQSEALPLISTLDRLNREQEIAGLRAQASAAAFQQQIDAASGYASTQDAAAQATRRRADAEAAFLPLLEREAELNKQAKGREDFLKQLEREGNAAGKTRSELMEMRAAELGVSQAAAPLIAKLREQEQALLKNGRAADQGKKALNAYGLSQKQFEFAMRGVPAQMTDIFISLQGGQNPITVLLQQGGQLKDMFGGIEPAAKALGGEMLKLVNVYTVSAAVIAALGVAAYQGSQEMVALNDAAIMTGNNMGATGERLNAMAQSLAATSDGVRSAAAEAVTAAASTGQFSASQLEIVSRAANTMNRDVKVAVKETVEQFVELGKNPVAAIIELDKKMHFLTASQYESIRALQLQGRETEAQTLAMEAYAQVIETRGKEVVANLGWLESGWRKLGHAAKWSWDQMMDIGREDSLEAKLREQTTEVERWTSDLQAVMQNPELRGNAEIVGGYREGLLARRGELLRMLKQFEGDKSKAEIEAARQSANETYIATQQLIDSQASKEQKKKQELAAFSLQMDEAIGKAKLSGELILATDLASQRAKGIAAIEKKYEEKKKPESFAAQNRFDLQALRDQLALEKSAIQTSQQLNQAAYSNKQITAEEYYRRQKELLASSAKVEESSLLKQIDYLKSANGNKREAINNQRQLGELETRLQQIREKSGTDLKLLAGEEARYYQERQYGIEDYARSLTDATEAVQRDFAARTAALGMGAREAQIQSDLTDVYVRQAAALRDLTTQRDRGVIGESEFAAKSADLIAGSNAQVQAIRDGYSAMSRAEADWRNGFTSVAADYQQKMGDIAGNTRTLLEGTFDGLNDAIAEAVMTGKANLDDLGKYLAKMAVQFGTTKIFSYLMSMWNPGGGAAAGSMANFGNNPGWTVNAKGNVYANSPSLSAYSNGVFSSPQVFAFAKGAGVFGEAGPEAIMPLARTSNGDLGVQMAGGGAGGIVLNVNVHGIEGGADVAMNESSPGVFDIDVISAQLERKQAAGIMNGTSPVARALTKRYELKER